MGRCCTQAKAKVPTFQAGLAEAANKLALASTADQGAEQLKKVVELLKTTDAQQRHLKGVLFGRICNEKGLLPPLTRRYVSTLLSIATPVLTSVVVVLFVQRRVRSAG